VKTESFVGAIRKLWDRAGDALLAVGLLVASLLLYVQTLAPSVASVFDDSLEFPLVAHRLAIAHQTGYPLYTLLGKLFTLAPWQNVAWRVNLLSAVAGALTVALIYLVVRQLTRRRLPALLAAVALAASPLFWSQSVIAEVYTLNSAFVAALLLLALHWARQPLLPVTPFSLLQSSPKEGPARFLPGEGAWSRVPVSIRRAVYGLYSAYRRFFPPLPPRRRLRPHPLIFALLALYSLSLTHHRMMLLLAPALFIFVLLVERRVFGRAALLGPEHPERPRWLQLVGRPVILLLLCLVTPLFFYLYLPLRGHVGSLDGTYANTWSGFWRWVMASGFSVFLGENPLARDLDVAFYGEFFWRQFGPVGLALTLVGLVGLARSPTFRSFRLPALALTGLAFVTYTGFAVVYRVPDVEVFFLPAFLFVVVWIGVGLDYAADLLRPRGRSMALRRLLAICGVLVFLGAILQPLVIAARNYPELDLSRRWTVHDFGQYILAQELPLDNSTVVGLGGEMTLLRYFQETEGLRADIDTIRRDDEATRREAIDTALAQGRAVYITRPLPGLAEDYALDAVTGLVEVPGELETLIRVGEPSDAPPDLPRPVNQEIAPGLRLLGYGVRENHGHWQAWTRLRLWWQAPEDLEEPFKVSARLVDAEGREVAVTDAAPVARAYPATVWRPGEVVADAYEIPLPAGLPPGEYTPLVIVYEPATGTELGRIELAPVYLQGNPARPPRQALEEGVSQTPYARFGDVELLGFTPPNPELTYLPRDTLPLTLLWQAHGQPSGELRVAFWLEEGGAYPLGEEPLGGRFPAGAWSAGQLVRHQPDLRVPESVSPGLYQLKMRVTRDGQPMPWGRWLIPLGSDLDLGRVQIGR
jgi:hypothetical protein